MPRTTRVRALIGVLLVCAGAGVFSAAAQRSAQVAVAPPKSPAQVRAEAAVAKVYDTSVLHRIDVIIAPEDVSKIPRRTDERVSCTFTFDGLKLGNVGVRQSGGVYHAYVPIANKPSLSVKFDEFVKGQTLFGVDKLILKNELQDLPLVNEHLTYEVFRRAGLAAPMTAHARVTINGIDSGIYLMREPIGKQFLVRNLGKGFDDGNLYEIENVREFVYDPGYPALDDEQKDGRSRSDIERLATRIRSSTPSSFVADVGPYVDLDRFMTFFASEAVTLHWDGFAYRNNNAYLYDVPKDGRFIFFPWGTDQAFGGSSGRFWGGGGQPLSVLAQKALGVPELAQRFKDEVDRIGREPVWNQQVLLDRLDRVGRILETAETSGRTGTDVARFTGNRAFVERFIKSGQ